MKDFDAWSKAKQWTLASIFIILLLVVMVIWVQWMLDGFFGYLAIFLVVPIFQFLATPLFRLSKVYTYLTPMVLVFNASDEKYDLHNGTSFDYWFHMRKTKSGKPWRHRLLIYYLKALLIIIDRIQNGTLPPTVIIRGSSYFFSDRTAKRFGFTTSETPSHERFNILLNYLDLIWMYSLAQGKLTFPKLKQIKTAQTTGEQLVEHKDRIETWLSRLQPH